MKSAVIDQRIIDFMADGKPRTIYDIAIGVDCAECTVRRYLRSAVASQEMFELEREHKNHKIYYCSRNIKLPPNYQGGDITDKFRDVPAPHPLMAALFGSRLNMKAA